MESNQIAIDGHTFGGAGNPIAVTGITIPEMGTRVQDTENPVGDDVLFGRDHRTAPPWTIGFRIRHRDPAAALESLGLLTRVWNDPAKMLPGAESALTYERAGRVRRVYGRTRGFMPDANRTTYMGRLAPSGVFTVRDPWHYAEVLRSLTLTLIPGDAGGLVSPLVSPLTTVVGGARQGLVTVEGDAPAPMEVVFRGPVTNPVASSTGWSVGLNATLAYDQSVTVDTRLGTALRNDGASLGGALSRHTYLPEARLLPGTQEIIFTGSDPTGTASCTVAWRPTYYGF